MRLLSTVLLIVTSVALVSCRRLPNRDGSADFHGPPDFGTVSLEELYDYFEETIDGLPGFVQHHARGIFSQVADIFDGRTPDELSPDEQRRVTRLCEDWESIFGVDSEEFSESSSFEDRSAVTNSRDSSHSERKSQEYESSENSSDESSSDESSSDGSSSDESSSDGSSSDESSSDNYSSDESSSDESSFDESSSDESNSDGSSSDESSSDESSFDESSSDESNSDGSSSDESSSDNYSSDESSSDESSSDESSSDESSSEESSSDESSSDESSSEESSSDESSFDESSSDDVSRTQSSSSESEESHSRSQGSSSEHSSSWESRSDEVESDGSNFNSHDSEPDNNSEFSSQNNGDDNWNSGSQEHRPDIDWEAEEMAPVTSQEFERQLEEAIDLSSDEQQEAREIHSDITEIIGDRHFDELSRDQHEEIRELYHNLQTILGSSSHEESNRGQHSSNNMEAYFEEEITHLRQQLDKLQNDFEDFFGTKFDSRSQSMQNSESDSYSRESWASHLDSEEKWISFSSEGSLSISEIQEHFNEIISELLPEEQAPARAILTQIVELMANRNPDELSEDEHLQLEQMLENLDEFIEIDSHSSAHSRSGSSGSDESHSRSSESESNSRTSEESHSTSEEKWMDFSRGSLFFIAEVEEHLDEIISELLPEEQAPARAILTQIVELMADRNPDELSEDEHLELEQMLENLDEFIEIDSHSSAHSRSGSSGSDESHSRSSESESNSRTSEESHSTSEEKWMDFSRGSLFSIAEVEEHLDEIISELLPEEQAPARAILTQIVELMADRNPDELSEDEHLQLEQMLENLDEFIEIDSHSSANSRSGSSGSDESHSRSSESESNSRTSEESHSTSEEKWMDFSRGSLFSIAEVEEHLDEIISELLPEEQAPARAILTQIVELMADRNPDELSEDEHLQLEQMLENLDEFIEIDSHSSAHSRSGSSGSDESHSRSSESESNSRTSEESHSTSEEKWMDFSSESHFPVTEIEEHFNEAISNLPEDEQPQARLVQTQLIEFITGRTPDGLTEEEQLHLEELFENLEALVRSQRSHDDDDSDDDDDDNTDDDSYSINQSARETYSSEESHDSRSASEDDSDFFNQDTLTAAQMEEHFETLISNLPDTKHEEAREIFNNMKNLLGQRNLGELTEEELQQFGILRNQMEELVMFDN